MSARKAKRRRRRTRNAEHAGYRLSGIVLTRGALQPLRQTLTLLGEGEPEFSMAEYRRPHVVERIISSQTGRRPHAGT